MPISRPWVPVPVPLLPDIVPGGVWRTAGQLERAVGVEHLRADDGRVIRQCADVLEHLRDPMRTLSILKTYLKPMGHIIASIPNVAHMSIKANLLVNDFTYTPIGLLDCTHIHLFTHKSIASGLAQVGLSVDQCKFTMQYKNACQPNDPYSELTRGIKRQLFKDWHSYVCQYVLMASPSSACQQEVELQNQKKLALNAKTAPQLISLYRSRLLTAVSEGRI